MPAEDSGWKAGDPVMYFDELTWRRYLPPLPLHTGYIYISLSVKPVLFHVIYYKAICVSPLAVHAGNVCVSIVVQFSFIS